MHYNSIKELQHRYQKKAGVFETKDIDAFIEHPNRTPYWLVRKVIIIVAYFGGLRHTELMNQPIFHNLECYHQYVFVIYLIKYLIT